MSLRRRKRDVGVVETRTVLEVCVSLTNQNSIQVEIKSRLKLDNACYYSVQNLLSSRLLSKNLKIKIYRNIIFPFHCFTVHISLIDC
jgi:hypothetical protein